MTDNILYFGKPDGTQPGAAYIISTTEKCRPWHRYQAEIPLQKILFNGDVIKKAREFIDLVYINKSKQLKEYQYVLLEIMSAVAIEYIEWEHPNFPALHTSDPIEIRRALKSWLNTASSRDSNMFFYLLFNLEENLPKIYFD